MSKTFADTRETPQEREAAEAAASVAANGLPNLVKTDTALAGQMNDVHAKWFLEYLAVRYEALRGSLNDWRAKMAKWERMSESNYEDRLNRSDPNSESPQKDVFSYQNDSLGMSEGFVDFFTAQARDDIFGTRPWLAATPEGKNDTELADGITKHAQWKFNSSNLEESLRDGIRIAAYGGTAFHKSIWIRDEEVYNTIVPAAFSKSKNEALKTDGGEFIFAKKDLPADIDGDDVEWRDTAVEHTVMVHNNVSGACLDYNDVAFDAKAPELNLLYTDFFCRFRMGLLDVMKRFNFPEDKKDELRQAVGVIETNARAHRGENSSADHAEWDPNNANPHVTLVEGFVRCDLLNTGRPIRIHVIFSPDLRILFSLDYLAGVTPEGILPVYPLRIHKIPGRIFGIGYFEKFELLNNSVDRKHNVASIRTKKSAHVFSSFQPDALREPATADAVLDPDKPFVLAEGKTIDDLISFKTMPDMTGPVLELRDQELQMGQMRSGITSAAQGELKGVPSANTATGTESIMSRGAILLKDQIDQLSTDITKIVEFDVSLLYANQDVDETFIWGEGREAQLVQIKAGDVRGLKMNVSLTLVQAQNQRKLEAANAAIQIATSYSKLPETEKGSQRPLYIQALASLGFKNAEDIIRPAAVDPAGILALMPPEIAPVVAQALAAAGFVPAAPGADATAAPVISGADS